MPRKRAPKPRRPRLEVWKFGGASLADAAAVRHAVSLVRAHRGPLVVVVSALAGVTDEEAGRAPAEGEWSVKQALAHLSIVERDHQCYTMAFAVDGWVDTGPGNPTADAGRLAAAMEITPTLEGLLARFLADGAETIALARHLPADMVAHKARFRRVSQGMVYLPDHTKEHVEQIKAAIQAARAG